MLISLLLMDTLDECVAVILDPNQDTMSLIP
jgi:hypothetical protein